MYIQLFSLSKNLKTFGQGELASENEHKNMYIWQINSRKEKWSSSKSNLSCFFNGLSPFESISNDLFKSRNL